MTLMVYNTLSRKKEEFKTVEKGKIKMYVCGMTVYSHAHIGHARTYFAFDVIRRYLEYKGYNVIYIQNITDVDDKIIAAANKEGVDTLEYSRHFTKICLEDLDKLGIRRADIYPKASETIPDMVEMIKKIIDRGFGYISNNDVYFSVGKFKDYGKLSGQNLEEIQAGARVKPGETKKDHYDFALWKSAKPGEPSWDSPWGKGRPGWHIECSVMSSKYLGMPFDIHGGGMDLRFPHHENEIAQAEAATGKKFANYWLHIGLLTVNGEKMSKSIGNIINIKTLLEKWNPEVIRFFYAQTHYRNPPDFSNKGLMNAKKGLIKIYRIKEKLENLSGDIEIDSVNVKKLSDDEKDYLKIINDFVIYFEKAMDDDFNTPQAISAIFDFVNKSNNYFKKISQPNHELYGYSLKVLNKIGNILTLFQQKDVVNKKFDESIVLSLQKILSKYKTDLNEKNVEKILDLILKIREEARNRKDWNTSDNIRKELYEIGFEIQDTSSGSIWRKK